MKNLFDVLAPFYNALHIGSRRTFEAIAKIADFCPSDTVLDLGGGTGRIARFLVEKVARVIVLDPSEGMIRQCRKRHGLECVVGKGEELMLEDGAADKVFLVDAFHHIPDQRAAVREIKRVLKPGGRVIVGEFNPETRGGKMVVFLERFLRAGSTFHTPAALAALFGEYGFSTRIVDEGGKVYYLIAEKA
ncbi:MAG: class I SAM-dependent methyltransferase [Candidatus Liptonbacteria bacterium]|nr:class I SAM-dependent methyltransferase [Candidatus Liptonbacteria bacterium]